MNKLAANNWPSGNYFEQCAESFRQRGPQVGQTVCDSIFGGGRIKKIENGFVIYGPFFTTADNLEPIGTACNGIAWGIKDINQIHLVTNNDNIRLEEATNLITLRRKAKETLDIN